MSAVFADFQFVAGREEFQPFAGNSSAAFVAAVVAVALVVAEIKFVVGKIAEQVVVSSLESYNLQILEESIPREPPLQIESGAGCLCTL